MKTEVINLERMANSIGVTAALRLFYFFAQNSETLYIPEKVIPGHLIEKVIGPEAFDYLVQTFGGETISIPNLGSIEATRREGWIFSLAKKGVPKKKIADLLGIGERHVYGVIRGFEKAGLLPNDRAEALRPAMPPVLEAAGELRRRVLAALVADSKLTRSTRNRAALLLERAEKLLTEAASMAGLGQSIMAGAACGAIEQAEALMQEGTVHA